LALDLYAKYKAFHLRDRKAAGEKQKLYATECLNLMRKLLDKPNLPNAGLLQRAEKKYLLYSQSNLLHSKEIIKAIKSNDYEINRPFINKNFLTGHNPEVGYVYVAVSSDRKKEVKIGYTTLELERRLRKFKTRYDLKNFELYFGIWTSFPAEVEDLICEELRPFLSSGNSGGGSIEWFGVSPEVAAILICMSVKKKGTKKHLIRYGSMFD
jgi:T5orf172 domain